MWSKGSIFPKEVFSPRQVFHYNKEINEIKLDIEKIPKHFNCVMERKKVFPQLLSLTWLIKEPYFDLSQLYCLADFEWKQEKRKHDSKGEIKQNKIEEKLSWYSLCVSLWRNYLSILVSYSTY